MRRLLCLLLALTLFPAGLHAADNSTTYYIPPPQFNASLQIMDGGFVNLTALFRNATGSFTFDDTAKAISNLRLAIDATSLLASNDANQRDIANLLDAFKYSEIRITAPDAVTFKDDKAEIKATLSFHGSNKPVTLEATLNRIGKTPISSSMWGGEGQAIGLTLHTTIKRADFGMADEAAAVPARFGDTITLALDVQAIKQ